MLRLQFHTGIRSHAVDANRNLGALSGREVGDFKISFADPLAAFVEQVEIKRGRGDRFGGEVFRRGFTQEIALARGGTHLAQLADGKAQDRVLGVGGPREDGISGQGDVDGAEQKKGNNQDRLAHRERL